MTHTYSIGNMLEIKDKNIKLEEKTTEEQTNKGTRTVFYGTLTYTPKGCMKCGVIIAFNLYQPCGSFYQ